MSYGGDGRRAREVRLSEPIPKGLNVMDVTNAARPFAVGARVGWNLALTKCCPSVRALNLSDINVGISAPCRFSVARSANRPRAGTSAP